MAFQAFGSAEAVSPPNFFECPLQGEKYVVSCAWITSEHPQQSDCDIIRNVCLTTTCPYLQLKNDGENRSAILDPYCTLPIPLQPPCLATLIDCSEPYAFPDAPQQLPLTLLYFAIGIMTMLLMLSACCCCCLFCLKHQEMKLDIYRYGTASRHYEYGGSHRSALKEYLTSSFSQMGPLRLGMASIIPLFGRFLTPARQRQDEEQNVDEVVVVNSRLHTIADSSQSDVEEEEEPASSRPPVVATYANYYDNTRSAEVMFHSVDLANEGLDEPLDRAPIVRMQQH